MDPAASSFLYALATVSITFVGFSALLIVFRQGIGGGLTAYDSYFTLTFIQAGFISTAGALVPPALSLGGLGQPLVWRTSSAVAAILIIMFVANVPGRRRAATGAPIPAFLMILLSVQLLAGIGLALSALGLGLSAGAGPYAIALTTILFTSGIGYLQALHLILPQLIKK